MPLIRKRLGFFRVISIQGARQTGKSVCAAKLLPGILHHSRTVTLDAKILREEAQNSPDHFLERHKDAHPFVIDEAQKAPNLFDAVKLRVDSDTRPGQYVLLGSTEFSRQVLIRESLTGRLGRVRMFPMCYRELIGVKGPWKVARADILRLSEAGGLPGIAFVRGDEERRGLFEDWLELVCYRDLQNFKHLRLDGDLAFEILRQLCLLEEPSGVELSRKLRQPGRRIQVHLMALEQLFAIQKVLPHPAGSGKSNYLILDAGLAHYFGADLRRRLQITLMNELQCYWAYFLKKRLSLYYYRSKSRRHIDLIAGSSADENITAYQLLDTERVPGQELEILKAFKAKVPKAKLSLFVPARTEFKEGNVHVLPWESLVFDHRPAARSRH